ncbi:LytTR family DNA-binding domain-containing protein [Cytophagaceae bacterium YF14B1]|uniref:LytTR family DNA-binding domain-containing protein n=1 Tax=Xanthocytophaga flava TaxID=3048013 RepID=A0AAE3U972_9BACT|nr:LytTR family DNA-binding domain-containing protein [Xanthocytophaga flavus]MDJ1483392.1 LytTR family DNA-binding domain-containing protein [Xanthocytophaga flavus]
MKLTAIAIDDEPSALEVVSRHASKVPFLELVATFTDAFDAIPFLRQNRVDLLFVDIKMPDISGIEFVQTLSRVPMVVFTTAYSEYAVQGFELDAIDYLLKPFSLVRFTKSCTKALEIKTLREGDSEKFIFVKTGYEEEKVLLDDIFYIESDGNYLIFTLKGRKLLSRQTMTDILQMLPEGAFIRVHRSYIIAISKIEKISRHQLWIADHEIPIGASYEESLTTIRERINAR